MLQVSVTRTGDFGRFAAQAIANTEGRVLERALVAGALVAVNRAKQTAPYITGNLRRSIHIGGHESATPDRQGIVRRGRALPEPDGPPRQRGVYWGTDVEYARDVEFGTERRRPNPFIRRASDETRAAVVREVGEALVDLIRAAVRT